MKEYKKLYITKKVNIMEKNTSIISKLKLTIANLKKSMKLQTIITQIPKPTFDTKTILLIVFFTISLIFGYKWYFGSNVDTNKLKDLEKKYKDLEEQKKVVDSEITNWKTQFDALKIKDDALAKLIPGLEKDIRDAEARANKSKADLDKIRLHILEIQKKIEEFKKHPSNRSGDTLLESIKNETK